ncbi:MAG: nucleoside triphosphate pyrophosphohydrolase [Deltaproteobacteria bacterium]
MSRPAPLADEARLTEPPDADRDQFGAAFERLVGIMARLRGEDGCPWDREQDLESLKPFLVEEAYEVLDAIDDGDPKAHAEELGDLLLQVVFQSEVRRQDGDFDVRDVVNGISDKLVRRHPHVFGDRDAHDADHAYKRWEEMKAKEKGDKSVLSGVPRQLPALLRAQRVTDKASKVGFDWDKIAGPIDKLDEELAELKAAVASNDPAQIEHELGDLLFTMVNVARFVDVNAEEALRRTVDRFSRRFEHVERAMKDAGRPMQEASLDELEARWEEAKVAEAQKIS